jgi:hypothetical protein
VNSARLAPAVKVSQRQSINIASEKTATQSAVRDNSGMDCSEHSEHHQNGGMNGAAHHPEDAAVHQQHRQLQQSSLSAVEQIRCGEWINIGGAIDMKVSKDVA